MFRLFFGPFKARRIIVLSSHEKRREEEKKIYIINVVKSNQRILVSLSSPCLIAPLLAKCTVRTEEKFAHVKLLFLNIQTEGDPIRRDLYRDLRFTVN